MKPRNIKAFLATAPTLPIFIWGPPGVGKSSVVSQVGKEKGQPVYDLRMTLMDPTDLRGIPVPQDGHARWLPPSFLPSEGPGILFFDELNTAPPLVQASAYQLVLDRRCGEYRLPEGVVIIAAGNRSGDRALVHRMPSALANRFIHLDFEVDLEDWTLWAGTNSIRPEVIAFLRFRPDLLFVFDPQTDIRAFPSPRTWEYVSKLLSSSNAMPEIIEGTVGSGAGAEFMAFIARWTRLPDPDEILVKGNLKLWPKDLDLQYALVTAVASRAGPSQLNNTVEWACRIPAEFSVLLVKLLAPRHRQPLMETKGWDAWVKQHRDIVL